MYDQFPNNGSFQPNGENKPENKSISFALTAFVLSLVIMLFGCCAVYDILAFFLILMSVVVVILGVISLKRGEGGKGFSITAIVLASLTGLSVLTVFLLFGDINRDLVKFCSDPDGYVDEYDRTGEVPEEFSKYCDEKYDDFWKAMGVEDFNEFYGELIEQFKQQYGYGSSSSRGSESSGDTESSDGGYSPVLPDDYGEAPVSI